jgi:hypothetical protein
MQLPVRITVETREGVVIPPEASFVDFHHPGQVLLYVIADGRAMRTSVRPLLRGDGSLLAVSPEQIAPGTTLALGNYLENVRLPASFSVEVIR